MTKPPEDLRAEILPYLYGIGGQGKMRQAEAACKEILRLCEAAAMYKQKQLIGDTLTDLAVRPKEDVMKRLEYRLNELNELQYTAQANIHSVFGGQL